MCIEQLAVSTTLSPIRFCLCVFNCQDALSTCTKSANTHRYCTCGDLVKLVANPETLERGDQETLNINCLIQSPSFYYYFVTDKGGGHCPLASPWIHYWKLYSLIRLKGIYVLNYWVIEGEPYHIFHLMSTPLQTKNCSQV